MNCPACFTPLKIDSPACPTCDFKFHVETDQDHSNYYKTYKNLLTTSYTQAHTPWEQSGKSGTYFDWCRGRMPIAEAITSSGTFLDIGCANGFLIESILNWHTYSGLKITPYGLDYSAELLAIAKSRLPQLSDNFYFGNSAEWNPPFHFDYVRTESVYVPTNLRKAYIARLVNDFLTPNGKLLLCEYRSSKSEGPEKWFSPELDAADFAIEATYSGFSNSGIEICRVAVINS